MLNKVNLKNKKLSMKELSIEEKRRICSVCPIFHPERRVCNSKLWINPNTDDISTSPKSGYIRGCGCIIEVRIKNKLNHCVAGKW